jgi:small subunit ribosomal protein S16
MFRVVVQDARRTPSSGKIVALLGSYDPHAKSLALDKEKATFYLKNGAQPSDRAARLLENEGVKMPGWVSVRDDRQGKLRNPEKLRRNQAKEAPAAEAEAQA